MSKILIVFIYVITIASGGIYINYIKHLKPQEIIKTVTITKNKTDQLLVVTKDDLQLDLQKTYNFLSIKQQQQILNAIVLNCKKYSLNSLVVYSVIAVESSFQFWVKSPTSTVTGSDGKKHRDNAIGLMSIMYSIHNKDLKEAGIITTKTELRQIGPNIAAGCFILAKMRKTYKGDMNKAIKAYFGITSKYAGTYLQKIKTKFGSLVYNKIH